MKIDNFALTMHQTCPAKYDLRMRQHYTTRFKSGALGFGGALHAGLAEWYKTGQLAIALQRIADVWPDNLPIDDFRTKEKCLTVMIEYTKKYPAETFTIIGAPDHPMIEVPFTLELGMYLPCVDCGPGDVSGDPESPTCANCGGMREPIEYGGIFDGLVEFSGQIFNLEHKSTSMLGSSYFNQFKPNNQVTGYIWGSSEMSGRKVAGSIINAIGIYKVGATKFERHITSRSPAALAEWKRNVYVECCNIKEHERLGYFPMRTQACTMYGLCEFHPVHVLEHPTERERRLETDYVREEWDYENREA